MLPLDAEMHQDVHSPGDRTRLVDARAGGVTSHGAQVLIRRLSCNHDLSRQERFAIADALERGSMPKAGAAIDSAASRLVVLTAGLVAASVTGPSGRSGIGAIYVPGDILNLSGFMLQQEGYDLAAASACEMAFLPADRAARLTRDFPGVRQSFLRQLGLEMAMLRKRMEPRKPSEAIAHLYCELYTRHRLVGLVHAGQSFDLPLKQYQLAEAVGVSLVHTNKSARALKNEGLLAFTGNSHTILDFEGLAKHAQFSPDYLSIR